MTEDEKLERLKAYLDIDDTSKDKMLNFMLSDAQYEINRIRKYTPTETQPVESKYESIQVQMALAAYNKLGAEGESGHTEQAITRSYESGSVYPLSLISKITPVIGSR